MQSQVLLGDEGCGRGARAYRAASASREGAAGTKISKADAYHPRSCDASDASGTATPGTAASGTAASGTTVKGNANHHHRHRDGSSFRQSDASTRSHTARISSFGARWRRRGPVVCLPSRPRCSGQGPDACAPAPCAEAATRKRRRGGQ